MADHDGHTINVGPVTVGREIVTGGEDDAHPPEYGGRSVPSSGDPIDTDAIRTKAQALIDRQFPSWAVEIKAVNALALCDEVDRLRAENTALAAALDDIAGISFMPDGGVLVNGECARFQDPPCHVAEPLAHEEWCGTCVAEVAWCAWKLGVLGA